MFNPELEERIMVANALLVTTSIVQGYLFWLTGELIFFTFHKGVLFHAYGKIVLEGHGFATPRESPRGFLDQRELTAGILSL